jgi:glycosyltransferase involved in cell wall biosynthesis
VRWWNACAYYAVSIALAQKKLGHDVWVAGDPDFLATQYARQAGLTVVEVPFSARNPFRYLAGMKKLHSFIQRNKIVIVNAHRPEDHLVAALAGKKSGIPVVRTVGDVRAPKKNILNRYLHDQLTSFMIFSSTANLIRYQSYWPDIDKKSAVIHGGVNLEIFYPREKNAGVLKKLELAESAVVLGQIGRLSVVKDFPTTIKALALVVEERQDVHLIISGQEGKVKVSRLKELAASYNVERYITFLDHYNPVEELIGILDIGIIASKDSEAICRIAMEYMAMGIPVVATDVNVLPEIIIDHLNGLIVPADDPVGMATAISEIINNQEFRRNIKQHNIDDARTRLNILTAAAETIRIYGKSI